MERSVEEVIREWPKEPRESAERLLEHYGLPDEVSESRLVWHNTKDCRKK
jgi:hypothetical protein